MGNRYIHPNDELVITLEMKVKVKAVGDWSGIGVDVTQKNYDGIKDNGNLVEYIKEHIEKQIMWEGEINLDFIDRIIYEIVD